MRDGSVMADSYLVDFLSGPTDSAINFNGSADLHTPIHPPLLIMHFKCIDNALQCIDNGSQRISNVIQSIVKTLTLFNKNV